MHMAPEPLVVTKNLLKRFQEQVAVRDVSLTVNRGDVYGFLGLNGAGKSTSLRLILGLLRPDGGRISLFGESGERGRRRAMARIGAMVESPSFYRHLSGRRNLELLGALGGGVTRGRIEQVLELVGLKEAAHRKANHYSLGMKQRLGIALALLNDPELVVLDEPANGLDPNGILEMRQLIQRLNSEQGTTFLVSSHLLYEIELMCNRIAILDKGQVVYEGSPAEFGRQETPRFCISGPDLPALQKALGDLDSAGNIEPATGEGLLFECPRDRLPDLHRELVRRDIALFTLKEERMTLEEFFLRQAQQHQDEESRGS